MASIGVGLTAQLGAEFWALVLQFIVEFALWHEGDGVENTTNLEFFQMWPDEGDSRCLLI